MENKQPPVKKVKRGVYFLSNNNMYEFTIAFLNSFRLYNPAIPLCFIPYNDEVDKIEGLQDVYRFRVFPDKELLREYDRLSLQLHESVRPEYRKLVAWDGLFDEFLYIDIDTVVLDDLSFAFEFMRDYDCLTATSNIPEIRKFVWLDGIGESGLLDAAQIAYAANTGFIVSKKGFINRESVTQSMEKARMLKDYMELQCMEQPFLNYLIVTSGKPYTSLCVLGDTERYRKVLYEYWGGEYDSEIINGKLYRKTGGQICFVHWSGVWRLLDRMPNKKIWDYYRNLVITDTNTWNDPALLSTKSLPAHLVS